MASRIRNHFHDAENVPEKPCALLWDESFLWGVMAWRALDEAGLPFDLIRAVEIREGGLDRYRMLFVPGGWASNKIDALGKEGREQIRRFVASGGSYLGICGGAGMATANGLDLLPILRRPSSERVPSFSGRIRLSCTNHEIWQGVYSPVFHAWWPSQFLTPEPDVHVLARYKEPQEDAFSSDIHVADGGLAGWSDLEQRYGILLDPARLSGEPAVVEGRFGAGKVVLSLIHFDTPGDRDGATILKNLWACLSTWGSASSTCISGNVQKGFDPDLPQEEERFQSCDTQKILEAIGEIRAAVADLIETGTRNFLWFRRNPLLLHWRRGVRGLECSTLDLMVGEIAKRLDRDGFEYLKTRPGFSGSMELIRLNADLAEIRRLLIPFAAKARHLLVRERFYIQRSPLSPLVCDDEEIQRLRQELFGPTMSHGGEFKHLIGAVDGLLYKLIRKM